MCGCELNNDHVHAHDYCDISTDLKLNTRASVATYHVLVFFRGTHSQFSVKYLFTEEKIA